MTQEQQIEAWGEELYNAFSEWIDENGWLVDNWADYLEDNYSNWDKNYNDTNIKSNLYSQMYNLNIEFLDENESACRPVELREIEVYNLIAFNTKKTFEEVKKMIPEITPEIENAIRAASNFNEDDYSEDDTVLTTREALLALKEITHSEWQDVFTDKSQWQSVLEDIKREVTFFFYWRDNLICWVR